MSDQDRDYFVEFHKLNGVKVEPPEVLPLACICEEYWCEHRPKPESLRWQVDTWNPKDWERQYEHYKKAFGDE